MTTKTKTNSQYNAPPIWVTLLIIIVFIGIMIGLSKAGSGGPAAFFSIFSSFN